jgi:hypothetical protein
MAWGLVGAGASLLLAAVVAWMWKLGVARVAPVAVAIDLRAAVVSGSVLDSAWRCT